MLERPNSIPAFGFMNPVVKLSSVLLYCTVAEVAVQRFHHLQAVMMTVLKGSSNHNHISRYTST
jgi:hypothetical protein